MAAGYHHNRELSWEESRWIGALIYNANSKKSKSPQQLVPLNLDKKRKKQGGVTTQEDIATILKYHKKRLTPQNGK